MTRNILNEKIVMQAYIDELDAGRVDFLAEHAEDTARIRTLLLEMIAADRINERIRIAVKLWKALFAPAMSYIDPNREGYDSIFAYFDAYVEFEELIFASDSFYRDHTLHCLWVYFLGEYIYRCKEYASLFDEQKRMSMIIKMIPSIFDELGFDKNSTLIYKNAESAVRVNEELEHYESAARCIKALTHDLGYPIKKIEKINKSIKSVLPFFSLHSFADFSFSYDESQQHFIKSFLDMLALSTNFAFVADGLETDVLTKIFKLDGYKIIGIGENLKETLTLEEIEKVKNGLKMQLTIVRSNSSAMMSANDFEDYKHGIMSAYLLTRNLAAFKNIDYKSGYDLAARDLLDGSAYTKLSILSSITMHTAESFTISALEHENYLTFIDELEEFSRISRASQSREYVEEFCSTGIYMEDGVLNIDFIFDNDRLENLDPERAFKGRCKRFLSLFSVHELELKLISRCIGRLERNRHVYELELWRKHAVIKIDGVEQDIPTYLKSNQFYTSAGYAAMN